MFQLRAGVVARASHPAQAQPLVEVPSVTIAVSEQDQQSTARWRIRIEAKTETGRWVLGTVLTIAPSAPGGDVNRIVAIATVPGAIAWMVQAELEPGTGTPQSEAMLEMASSNCCGSLGLVAVAADVVGPIIVVPSGFVLARSVHLASQALPGAGAFTAQPFQVVPIATKRVTFWVTYTRGAAGGFPAFRAEWANGVEQAREGVEDISSLVIAQPNGTTGVLQQELTGPLPQDGTALVYPLVFELPDAAIGVRLLAAERGVAGTPGTIAMALTGSG